MFYELKQVLSQDLSIEIYYGPFNSVAVYGIKGWDGLYNTGLGPFDR